MRTKNKNTKLKLSNTKFVLLFIFLKKYDIVCWVNEMEYTIEEFDKAKTKVMNYIMYKKRTEHEVKNKFSRFKNLVNVKSDPFIKAIGIKAIIA